MKSLKSLHPNTLFFYIFLCISTNRDLTKHSWSVIIIIIYHMISYHIIITSVISSLLICMGCFAWHSCSLMYQLLSVLFLHKHSLRVRGLHFLSPTSRSMCRASKCEGKLYKTREIPGNQKLCIAHFLAKVTG